MDLLIRINIDGNQAFVSQAERPETEPMTTPKQFLFDVEKMIDFGAHSREFIEFLFEHHMEELIRSNLKKLLQNGMKLRDLFDCEEKTVKDKTPQEITALLNWYIDHIGDLGEGRDPHTYLTALIGRLNLDKYEEGCFILRATEMAYANGQMDGLTCACYYYTYKHDFDEDVYIDLSEKDSSGYREMLDILDRYFSDDYDDFEEEEDY
ncbi:hypothetical protein J5500_01635 [Candidatus Saccharibacteria bacterium]|nr:hypothetical protein [Candidatus Saccharibacteria bacterium]